MPEYIIGIILTAIIGGSTYFVKRIEDVDGKVDRLELKVSETYATKEALSSAMDRLESYSRRIEDKLDILIFNHNVKEKDHDRNPWN